MPRLAAFIICLLAAVTSAATEVERLAPVPNGGHRAFLRWPQHFSPTASGELVFIAQSERRQAEAWVTNGTAAGTRMVADLCSTSACTGSQSIAVNGRVVLVMADAVWATSGVQSDTQLLYDDLPVRAILPFPIGRFAYFLVGQPKDAQVRILRTDGTTSGTSFVGAFPNRTGWWYLSAFGSRLAAASERELWTWDAGRGSVLVRSDHDVFSQILLPFRGGLVFKTSNESRTASDIWFLRPAQLAPKRLFSVAGPVSRIATHGNKIVFVATDAAIGQEVFRADPVTGKTVRLTTFAEPAPLGDGTTVLNSIFSAAGDRFVFRTLDAANSSTLWSVGLKATSATPILGCPDGCPDNFNHAYPIGKRLIFTAMDSSRQHYVYVTDGTATGTLKLPTPPNTQLSLPLSLFDSAKAAVLETFGGTSLPTWFTDGTPAGTRQLFDSTSQVRRLIPFGSRYLLAMDNALWQTDGTASGTTVLKDPLTERTEGAVAFPEGEIGGRAIYQGWTGQGPILVAQDATSRHVMEIGYSPCSMHIAPDIGQVIFRGRDNDGTCTPYWRWDGSSAPRTALGTANPLAVLPSWLGRAAGETLGAFSNGVYRVAADGFEARGPLPIPFRSFLPTEFTGADRLFCTATDLYLLENGGRSFRLLAYGGCPADVAARVGDWILTLGPSGYRRCNLFGCQAVALANDDLVAWISTPTALWIQTQAQVNGEFRFTLRKFDASGAITEVAQPCGGAIARLAPAGNRLVLQCDDYGLWSADSTLTGLISLKPGPPGGRLQQRPAAVGTQVLFVGHDLQHGVEPWITDGTPAGTQLLADLNPGPASSDPANFKVQPEGTLFTAFTDGSGLGVWVARP